MIHKSPAFNMNENFYRHIFQRHQKVEIVPPNELIASWAIKVLGLLYPEQSGHHQHKTVEEVEQAFYELEQTFIGILDDTQPCKACNSKKVAKEFFSGIPALYELLNKDAAAILEGDPAARNAFEIIRTYPGFFAISFYRVAHELFRLEVPVLPRILTEYAHSHTGIDIHPAAEIGEYFCIDHGTGIVIGETTIIGDYVKLYQGVTLGALSVDKQVGS